MILVQKYYIIKKRLFESISMLMKWTIQLAQKISAIAFVKKMLFISKSSWFQLLQILPLAFYLWVFWSSLQVGQINSYGVSTGLLHVKMIAVFITHV